MSEQEGSKRLGYGQLEEDILNRFNPYKDMPDGDGDGETFWRSTLPHERIIDPVALNEAMDTFLRAEREHLDQRKHKVQAFPRIVIRKGDLERFREETGLRPWEAEEYFVLANGDLGEALLVWMNQVPGSPPRQLALCEHPVRFVSIDSERSSAE